MYIGKVGNLNHNWFKVQNIDIRITQFRYIIFRRPFSLSLCTVWSVKDSWWQRLSTKSDWNTERHRKPRDNVLVGRLIIACVSCIFDKLDGLHVTSQGESTHILVNDKINTLRRWMERRLVCELRQVGFICFLRWKNSWRKIRKSDKTVKKFIISNFQALCWCGCM